MVWQGVVTRRTDWLVQQCLQLVMTLAPTDAGERYGDADAFAIAAETYMNLSPWDYYVDQVCAELAAHWASVAGQIQQLQSIVACCAPASWTCVHVCIDHHTCLLNTMTTTMTLRYACRTIHCVSMR